MCCLPEESLTGSFSRVQDRRPPASNWERYSLQSSCGRSSSQGTLPHPFDLQRLPKRAPGEPRCEREREEGTWHSLMATNRVSQKSGGCLCLHGTCWELSAVL